MSEHAMEAIGKMLLALGAVIVVLGMLLILLGKTHLAGRLPGDLTIKWETASCFFPLMTGVVLSIVATIILNLILWLLRK